MSWAALLLTLFAPVPIAAQSAERDSTLLLSVAAPAQQAEPLEAVTRELLGRLDVQVELRRVARIEVADIRHALRPAQRYFARAWISFSKSGGARLYLEHSATDRVLVRDVAGDPNNPELVREELGHILQTAVEGLKAGEEVGAPRGDVLKAVAIEEAPRGDVAPPAPPPAAPAASTARSKPLRFGPVYELLWLGDGADFEDGPGAIFEAAWPIGFELAGYYRRPLKVEAEPVGMRLQTLSARALVTLRLWQKERDAIRLGVGAGPDFVRVTPVAEASQAAELSDPAWLRLAVARLQASYARRAFDFLELRLTIGADLDLTDTRFVFQRRTGELRVLDPWPVRPFLAVGATVP